MTSLCATSDNSHGALPIRTPGTKKNGSGLTRAKLFIRTFSASLPTPAGARTWGTSKSPNCEVSIPAASTNLGGDGARLDSERRVPRSEEHTSELQSRSDIVCRLLLEKKKKRPQQTLAITRINGSYGFREGRQTAFQISVMKSASKHWRLCF